MSEVPLQVLNAPNTGEHLAAPEKGSAEEPCVLSERSKEFRGSSPPVQGWKAVH